MVEAAASCVTQGNNNRLKAQRQGLETEILEFGDQSCQCLEAERHGTQTRSGMWSTDSLPHSFLQGRSNPKWIPGGQGLTMTA